jgi:hypothetical protein
LQNQRLATNGWLSELRPALLLQTQPQLGKAKVVIAVRPSRVLLLGKK